MKSKYPHLFTTEPPGYGKYCFIKGISRLGIGIIHALPIVKRKTTQDCHTLRFRFSGVLHHLIREIIGRGDVRICKIPTEDNVADPLTKPLARVKHEAHANSIGMEYLEASS
ncbi:hypothetical protein OSB04_024666 [Centaurea solstitialis]|uniref:Uncharacterized protein n=1 Tax=Centaurea solstitialis TaxID=347529 RepID=A0AA38SN70_9ASTR|nr:hypothetical protein OSB04_024666 [Centaurea solstitialis]